MRRYWGVGAAAERNRRRVAALAGRAGLPPPWNEADDGFEFVAGSMFWFRPQALAGLAALAVEPGEFEPEAGQRDGTLAHALERFVGFAVAAAGFRIAETRLLVADEPPTPWLAAPAGRPGYPFAAPTLDGRPDRR